MPTAETLTFDAYVVEAAFLGETAAFALGDGTVELCEGLRRARATAHDGGLLAAAAAADGRSLISSGDDGRVVATAADGATTLLFEKPGKWIDRLAIGPKGAIACAAGRIAWVRLADGDVREFPHDKAVGGVAFLPKGLRLATATTDRARLSWITAAREPVEFFWKGAHIGVTVSPDGRFLVTMMQEFALHGWRIDDQQNMRMTGYPAKVKSVSWTRKGRFLATAGANAAILWPFMSKDGPMGKSPLQLGVRDQLVTRVAAHGSEDVVAIGYDDGMVLGVRIGDQAEALLVAPGGSPISALAWDRAGVHLAYGCEGGAAGIVDIRG